MLDLVPVVSCAVFLDMALQRLIAITAVSPDLSDEKLKKALIAHFGECKQGSSCVFRQVELMLTSSFRSILSCQLPSVLY